jgi:hypothetical protein
MSKYLPFFYLVLFLGIAAFSTKTIESAENINESVWSIDLVTTLPGQQAEYLEHIRNNWAQGRRIITEHGEIRSYKALSAPQDSSRGWDVMLMTEYSDSSSWSDREAIFSEVFASTEYARIPSSKPSSELREFFLSGIVMKELVSGPGH